MGIFSNLLTIGNDKKIIGLTRELKAIYIANYYKKYNKSMLIVTDTLYECNRLYQTILRYTTDVVFFPMDDFLTSEALAISPELKSTRLETLNTLIGSENKIVVTNLMGYLRFLPEKKVYNDSIIKLGVGDSIDLNQLVEKLVILGYEKSMLVEKTGDFALRGFVVDIYPLSSTFPIRIEFFGDEVESIKEFDVETQRTTKKLDSVEIYPNTEFITNKYQGELKQRDLIKYGKVVNISDYLNNSVVIYDNFSVIKDSNKLLLEEIVNYNIEQNLDINTVYMHNFDDLYNFDSIIFEKYDESINSVDNTLCIESYLIEPFNNLSLLKSYIEKQLKNKKTIIICVSNRYVYNKLEEELTGIPLIFTNENEIENDYVNVIIKKMNEGFIYSNTISK